MTLKRLDVVAWVFVAFLSSFAIVNVGHTGSQGSKSDSAKRRKFNLKPSRSIARTVARVKPRVRLLGIRPGTKIYGGSTKVLRWSGVGVDKVKVEIVLPPIPDNESYAESYPAKHISIVEDAPPRSKVAWLVSRLFFRNVCIVGYMNSTTPIETQARLQIVGYTSNRRTASQSIPVHLTFPDVEIVEPVEGTKIYRRLWHTIRWNNVGAKAPEVEICLRQLYSYPGEISNPRWSVRVPNTGTYRMRLPEDVGQEVYYLNHGHDSRPGKPGDEFVIWVETVFPPEVLASSTAQGRDLVVIKLY